MDFTREEIDAALRPGQDIYSARELAHRLLGVPYEEMTRSDIFTTLLSLQRNLQIPGKGGTLQWRDRETGRSELFTVLHIMRNVDKYKDARGRVCNRLVRAHVEQWPLPPLSKEQRRRRGMI